MKGSNKKERKTRTNISTGKNDFAYSVKTGSLSIFSSSVSRSSIETLGSQLSEYLSAALARTFDRNRRSKNQIAPEIATRQTKTNDMSISMNYPFLSSLRANR
jgi:hypothetical protein